LVYQDVDEVKREQTWNLFSKTVLDCPVSPQDYIRANFMRKYCKPKPQFPGMQKATIDKTERRTDTCYGKVRMPEPPKPEKLQRLPLVIIKDEPVKVVQKECIAVQDKFNKMRSALDNINGIHERIKTFQKLFESEFPQKSLVDST
jgi:hypothetical protein